jgi:hypothetical protein
LPPLRSHICRSAAQAGTDALKRYKADSPTASPFNICFKFMNSSLKQRALFYFSNCRCALSATDPVHQSGISASTKSLRIAVKKAFLKPKYAFR